MKRRVPLFPLGLVLLPRMPLPLHIFEERYRLMIRRCLEEETEFGVLLARGSKIEPLGTLARIDSVINRYEDGRLDILTVGTERITVEEFHTNAPYLQGFVERLHDNPSAEEDSLPARASRAIDALESFASQAGYSIDRELLATLEYEELSFFIASTDVFSLEEKQQLLRMRDTGRRLAQVTAGLIELADQRRQADQVRQLLGSDKDITHLFN
ncbi:MAG: LON peptidase substrate-binding domain-containing protein [Alkalispirochaetaceae bacterium]